MGQGATGYPFLLFVLIRRSTGCNSRYDQYALCVDNVGITEAFKADTDPRKINLGTRKLL